MRWCGESLTERLGLMIARDLAGAGGIGGAGGFSGAEIGGGAGEATGLGSFSGALGAATAGAGTDAMAQGRAADRPSVPGYAADSAPVDAPASSNEEQRAADQRAAERRTEDEAAATRSLGNSATGQAADPGSLAINRAADRRSVPVYAADAPRASVGSWADLSPTDFSTPQAYTAVRDFFRDSWRESLRTRDDYARAAIEIAERAATPDPAGWRNVKTAIDIVTDEAQRQGWRDIQELRSLITVRDNPMGHVLGAIGAGGAAAGLSRARAAMVAQEAQRIGQQIGALREAARTKGAFGLGLGAVSRRTADDLGRAWVGPSPRQSQSQPGVLISQDGLRQYRPPDAKPNAPLAFTGLQANFEWRNAPQGRWTGNGHLDVKP